MLRQTWPRQVFLVTVIYALIAGLLVTLAFVGFEILSGVRAFVEGESRWSKGQKQAIFYIDQFHRTRSEEDWRRYQQNIAVPKSYRKAREALQATPRDTGLARRSFIEAGTDEADVMGLVTVFVLGQDVSYVRHAVEVWTEGDHLIEKLDAYAQRLHGARSAPDLQKQREDNPNSSRQFELQFTPLELEFSQTLGAGARFLTKVMEIFIATVTVLLLVIGARISYQVARKGSVFEHSLKSEVRTQKHHLNRLSLENAELSKRAKIDPLTGLTNRRAMNEELHRQLDGRKNGASPPTRLAVMFIDLDKFKEINDQLGHEMGDNLLKQVSGRLLDATRSHDCVARLGGDEFVILAEGMDSDEDLHALCTRVIDLLKMPYPLGDSWHDLTASMGVACYPEHGQEAKLLLRKADAAMYEAKHLGRNRFKVFD